MPQSARDVFMIRKAEIDAILTNLQAACANHFGVNPDDIDWGDVGTISHLAETLKRAAATVGGEIQ